MLVCYRKFDAVVAEEAHACLESVARYKGRAARIQPSYTVLRDGLADDLDGARGLCACRDCKLSSCLDEFGGICSCGRRNEEVEVSEGCDTSLLLWSPLAHQSPQQRQQRLLPPASAKASLCASTPSSLGRDGRGNKDWDLSFQSGSSHLPSPRSAGWSGRRRTARPRCSTERDRERKATLWEPLSPTTPH